MLYPGTPALGTNAIEKGVKVLQALQSLERNWARSSTPSSADGVQFHHAGSSSVDRRGREGRLNIISNAGTTPNYASLEFNIWYLPTEEFETVRLGDRGLPRARVRSRSAALKASAAPYVEVEECLLPTMLNFA